MQIQKTKLAIAIGSLGLFMGAAQVANAGLVEVDVTAKTPTYSTDISGNGSDTQPFFAPNVQWTPGETIGAQSSVRFNLGGKDGNPAKFATNAIDVNNFVFVARNAVADAMTYTWAAGGSVLAQQNAVWASTAGSTNSTVAQKAAAINAGVVAGTDGGIVGGDLAAIDAAVAAQLAVADAAQSATIAAAIVAQFAGLAGTVAGPQVTAAVIPAGSYTNGDSATWFNVSSGTAYGRIFVATTAGGVGSFDVTVTVKPVITGDTNGETGGVTGDSVWLSLNGGRYVDNVNTPVTFATGTLLDSNVDVTNLKAQGFDGLPVDAYTADGSINIIVSVAQGGLTRDVNAIGNSNQTLFASSANPLQFVGFPGLAGNTAAATFPTTVNLAAEEKKFSKHSIAGLPNWYANGLDLPADSDAYNHIGSFTFNIASLSGDARKQYNTTGNANGLEFYTQVSDPIGNQYALTAGDTIATTVGVVDSLPNALTPFTSAGAYFLRSGAGDCSAAIGGGDIALTVDAAAGTASNSSAPLVSGTTYTVCARANGTSEIVPHTVNVTATLQNIEPTYQDPTFPAQVLGTWLRNGCDATFFNVPGNGPQSSGLDKAYLRFTNTTAASTAGTVRVKVYGQDGAVVGTGKIMATTGAAGLTGTLSGHQTGVYNAHDVARAIGMTPADTVANVFPAQRVRVVMSGGFSTCEGQNMIATPSGDLVNVTATTNANTNSIDVPGRERFNGNNSN